MTAWHRILLYTSFVLVIKCEITTAFNITRGRTDKFTNPRCVGGSCTSINCDGLNGANCVTPRCFECQCNSNNPTFYQNKYSDGTCVKNEKLLLSLSKCMHFNNLSYDKHGKINLDQFSKGHEVQVIDKNISIDIPYNAIDYLFL